MNLILAVLLVLFIGCGDIIEVPDISDKSITVLAPVNDAVLNQSEISFNWQPLEDADEYKIQIAKPNFTEALQIVSDSTITTNSFYKSLELGSYQWRVKALNSAYETNYTIQSFAVE